MRIHDLSLNNFRNYPEAKIEWSPGVNLITGPNGAGKTNLIDAIHYLCMTRSFVMTGDRFMATSGESWFRIEGRFSGEIRTDFTVSCAWSRGEGKKIFINSSPLARLSDLIGMVPVVVLSPEDLKLTADGPAVRRAFIDGFISQISSRYLQDLLRYQHVRRQRNRLLQEFQGPPTRLREFLEPWNIQLIETGTSIIAMRSRILERFREYLSGQFQFLEAVGLQPDLKYRTLCEPEEDEKIIREKFEEELDRTSDRERERGQTLVGPHRDEILFLLGEKELRNYGSQGQHRLFSAALKMAQLFYYSDELDDLPLMLLDDVFGNLDPGKAQLLLEKLLNHPGQCFITSATEDPFRGVTWSAKDGHYRVERGVVEKVR